MSPADTRIRAIRTRLDEAFAPEELEVIDESHLHIGHPGARDGRGHFRVLISSNRFGGTNTVARHRMIYEALGDLMATDIHALSIIARATTERAPNPADKEHPYS